MYVDLQNYQLSYNNCLLLRVLAVNIRYGGTTLTLIQSIHTVRMQVGIHRATANRNCWLFNRYSMYFTRRHTLPLYICMCMQKTYEIFVTASNENQGDSCSSVDRRATADFFFFALLPGFCCRVETATGRAGPES